MDARARVTIQIAAALLTAGSLAVDLAGVGGVPWQVPALLGFAVFAAVSWWQQWDAHQRLNAPQRAVRVVATGRAFDPEEPKSWRRPTRDEATLRLAAFSAQVEVALLNHGERRYVVSGIYLVAVRKPRWLWRRREIVKIDPLTHEDSFDALLDDTDMAESLTVNWIIEPEQPESPRVLMFSHRWRAGEGPKWPTHWDTSLVIEFGGPDRAKRVYINPPSGLRT